MRDSSCASNFQCSATFSYALFMNGSLACAARCLASSAFRRKSTLSDDIAAVPQMHRARQQGSKLIRPGAARRTARKRPRSSVGLRLLFANGRILHSTEAPAQRARAFNSVFDRNPSGCPLPSLRNMSGERKHHAVPSVLQGESLKRDAMGQEETQHQTSTGALQLARWKSAYPQLAGERGGVSRGAARRI